MDRIINVSELIEKYDKPFFEKQVEAYKKHSISVSMAVILTSDDPGCISYSKGIIKFCNKYSVNCLVFNTDSSNDLKLTIDKLNNDNSIDGIMIMYPTPYPENDTVFMNSISPEKDIEGLHNSFLGYLAQFEKTLPGDDLRKHVIPPTAKGILYIIKRYYEQYEKIKAETGSYPDLKQSNPFTIEGKHFTIINDSLAVGRSLALMLLNEHGSIQICHKFTPYYDILSYVRNSDFIISAVPSSKFMIPTDVINENSIIIDISFEGNFDYPSVIDKCYKIAPKWDLAKKGNRINDITLYRLLSNLFYLVNCKQSDEFILECGSLNG